jgi:hypothetical protein
MVPVVANVRDYGAVGDNRTDDTAAFLRALNDPKVGPAAVCAWLLLARHERVAVAVCLAGQGDSR